MLNRQLESIARDFNIEVKHGLVLDFLYFFTTRRDTAAAHLDEDIYQQYSKEKIEPIIRSLEKHYLLLRFKDNKNRAHTRLAHDALAPIIRDAFDRSDAWGQRARHILESRRNAIKAGDTSFKDMDDIKTLEMGRLYMRNWTPAEQKAFEKGKKAVSERIERELIMRQSNFDFAKERINTLTLQLNYDQAFQEIKRLADLNHGLEQVAAYYQELAFFWNAAGQKGKAMNAF